jgi:exonuclease SbcC
MKKYEPYQNLVFDPVEFAAKQERVREQTREQQKIQQLKQQLATVKAQVQTLVEKREALEKEEYISPEEHTQVIDLLAEVENSKRFYQQLQQQLAAAVASEKLLESQLAGWEKEQKKRERAALLRLRLERVREVLHRDNLPKIVMQRMLSGLNAYLEYYLSKFDTTFAARLDNDFNFLALFGKHEIEARRLSGGQKVALVIAFRFALSEYFAKTVPLLVLDEPTAWLDEANIGRMVEVLQMARTFTEKGVFVLVSTHEPALTAAMSRIVRLDEEVA